MAKGIHKGSEFHNIGETWDQNEKNKENERARGERNADNSSTTIGNELDKTIKEEADEYDHEDKENRVMGGERASVNDDPNR